MSGLEHSSCSCLIPVTVWDLRSPGVWGGGGSEGGRVGRGLVGGLLLWNIPYSSLDNYNYCLSLRHSTKHRLYNYFYAILSSGRMLQEHASYYISVIIKFTSTWDMRYIYSLHNSQHNNIMLRNQSWLVVCCFFILRCRLKLATLVSRRNF
jgi:hypothetical protein